MRNLMWAVLAAGAVLAGSEAAWANDTVRLGGPAAQASVDGGTDTFLVHRRFGYGGGYYGGGYGGRSYYGGGYYGRPFVSIGFYGRPYYGGYYGGYYGSSYYYPRAYYDYYAPTYYYRPYYYSSYFYPCAGDSAPATTIPGGAYSQAPATTNGDGTFSYDGNPRILVPMPSPGNKTNPAPGVLPIDGKLVSLPNEVSGGVLPVGLPTPERAAAPAPRVTYRAYGDEPIAPAPRKVNR